MPIFSLKLIIKEFRYHINENNEMQYRFEDLENDQDSE